MEDYLYVCAFCNAEFQTRDELLDHLAGLGLRTVEPRPVKGADG